MALVRTWPQSSGFPEYRTYQCFACVETMTIELEHSASPELGLSPPAPEKKNPKTHGRRLVAD
jgi:hypothetical protein